MSKLGDRRAAKFAAFRLSSARADAEAACPPGWTILAPTHDGDRWTAIGRLGDDSELGSGLTPSRALDCLAEALEARFGLNPKPEPDPYQVQRATELAAAIEEAGAACPPNWVLIDRAMDHEESGFDPYKSSPTFLVTVAYLAGTDWRAPPRDLGAVLDRRWGPDSVWGWSWLMNEAEAFRDLAAKLRARGQ